MTGPTDLGDLTRAAREFPAEHAYRHRLRADGRESLAHMLMLPEHGLAGFVYPTMRASGDLRGRACLFGPGVAEPVSEEALAPAVEGMDFDRWSAGPLSMRVVEPHREVEIGWHGERIALDGRFTALHPPYAFSLHPGGNPPYYGDDRSEQHGRFTASVRLDDRTLEHEGFLVRDHSWGPRIWGLNQHHKWVHAVAADRSVHLFEMQSFGRVVRRGFVQRDGVLSHIADVAYEIEYDDTMMQRRFTAELTDTDGTRTSVDWRAYASIQLAWDPEVYLNESAAEVEIDGTTGVGWLEFCWNRTYFDYAKSYAGQYGASAV